MKSGALCGLVRSARLCQLREFYLSKGGALSIRTLIFRSLIIGPSTEQRKQISHGLMRIVLPHHLFKKVCKFARGRILCNTSLPSAKPNGIDLRIIRSSDYVRRCTPCLMRFSAAFEDSLVGQSFSTPCTVASPRSKVRARPSLREHPLGGLTGFGVFGKFQRPLQMTLDFRQSLARECLEL